MKILVIFTGGTIGSSVTEGYISPAEKNKSLLINMYKKGEGIKHEFEECTPYTILSENLGGEHITQLIHCVDKNIRLKKYQGIIVTHGTDTLQYTASALGIVFEAVDIPVMLVSSNYPLEDERANGYDNFKAAVEYIENNGQAGVYTSYKNAGEEMQIFPADEMLKYDIYSDSIRRLPSKALLKNNHTSSNLNNPLHNKIHISPEKLELGEISPIKFITPYPGIQYDIPDENIKAILFGSYHSGTIQTARKELIEFCAEMKKREISMYICGVPDGTGYESTKYYEELGIEVLPYGTDIYWYMRLWIEMRK